MNFLGIRNPKSERSNQDSRLKYTVIFGLIQKVILVDKETRLFP